MPLAVTLSPADLAALLCSRICHDLISPVGAINNGIELYDEADAQEDAIELIRMSAVNASSKLQFARIAFGAAGSAGSEIDSGDAETVAKNYMENEKGNLDWKAPRLLLPKNEVKLLLNLVLIANLSIPRGGDIVVEIGENSGKRLFQLKVSGKMLRVPPKFLELYNGQVPEEPIDAHSVQFYYALLLSQMSNMPIKVQVKPEIITIIAG
ncbi:C-terminal [Bartonella apihabitans]|uniref:histidine phosphotransferase ChpT n=1 Tax=Bartonella apihabitans TaxID=2750929 RepID=UPI0018DDB7D9|nr:histidine phosphotransferase family protein [Bartonella apihabitans]MBI0020845.1 histidine phosphotransferase [Bartonella apihabitans]MBI0025321.1 histidine phosphotransferase [Bartonella apihabitans]MBI0166554.1 histidine phosphotransferase [Bartonella apihabitans]